MLGFKKVTKEEFYDSFKNKDAIVSIDDSNGYPYPANWHLRGNRTIIAKEIPITSKDVYPVIKEYFIME